MSRVSLERRDPCSVRPARAFADHGVFQTEAWLAFVKATQHAEPIHAALVADGVDVGRFTGLVVRKGGLRILGSPVPGWTTSYMGFNLDAGVDRTDALSALERFAFHDLGCVHFELMDRWLTEEDVAKAGLRYRVFAGFEVDLAQSEEALLQAMTSSCRRCIRKSRDQGVVVEPATDDGFVDDYYGQLQEVFGRQGLAPTYPRSRVSALIEHVHPSGQLLLLRARDSAGACIATGIFPGAGQSMYFWGGASRTETRILRPNEALQWAAMRHWRARGVVRYDMGGGGDYKRKYGGAAISVPWVRHGRWRGLEPLRSAVKELAHVKQTLAHHGVV